MWLSTNSPLSGYCTQVNRTLANAKQFWSTINFFKKESTTVEILYRRKTALVASRIYFTVLIFSVIVLALFNYAKHVVVPVSIQISSITMFENMHATYPSSLSCPCQNISIPYSTFITVLPTYHQVCRIVKLTWIQLSLKRYGSHASYILGALYATEQYERAFYVIVEREKKLGLQYLKFWISIDICL